MTDIAKISAIGRSTKKEKDGTYTYRVYAVIEGQPTETLAMCKDLPTRAMATDRAKKWTLYYRRQRTATLNKTRRGA